MTTKLEQAARQALEALEDLIVYSWNDGKNGEPDKAEDYAGIEAITALREALDHSGDVTDMVHGKRPQNCGTGYCSCIECPYEAEQAEQEPVAKLIEMSKENFERHWGKNEFADWIYSDIADLFSDYAAPQPVKQEPVAWMREDGVIGSYDPADYGYGMKVQPLYAAPVRTKDLTDDEICDVLQPSGRYREEAIVDARAVIAADREKNRG